MVSWLEDRRCNLHYIDQPIYFPSWLPDEARSAKFAIYLFAEDVLQSIHPLFDCWVRHMRSAVVMPFLQSCLSWPFWLPRMRHEVPNWWPRCAILPSITLLIAEDEAWSAEFMPILAIPPLICPFWLLSEAHAECWIGSGYTVYFIFIPFFMYFPESFCLPDLFLAYHLVTHSSITSFFFPIYNSAWVGHLNLPCFWLLDPVPV